LELPVSDLASGPYDSEQEREYQRQLEELVRSLDEAAEDLERNGPVSAEELRRGLLEVFAELSGELEPR
jgi:hypothetical protein